MIGFGLITDRNILKSMTTSMGASIHGYYRANKPEVKIADRSSLDRTLLRLSAMFSGMGFRVLHTPRCTMGLFPKTVGEFTSVNRIPVYYWKYIFGTDYSTNRDGPAVGRPVVIRDDDSRLNNELFVYINDYVGVGKLTYITKGDLDGYNQPEVFVRGTHSWGVVTQSMWADFNGGNEMHTQCVIPTFSVNNNGPMSVVFKYEPTTPKIILDSFGSIMEPRDDSSQKQWTSRSKAEVYSIAADSLNL